MPDPQTTIREQMVAEGRMPDVPWHAWIVNLKAEAARRGWGDDYVADPVSYREAYDDAYRPAEILDEEAEDG